MLVSLLLPCLSTIALATEYSPSTLVPSAAPAAAGTGEVGAGAFYGGYIILDGGTDLGGSYLRGQVALTDRLSVGGSVSGEIADTALVRWETPSQGYVSGTAAARYSVVRRDHANLALYVGGGYSTGFDDQGSAANPVPMGMAGIAYEGGGRVRFDASVPFIYAPASGFTGPTPLVFSELGLTFQPGPHDRIRFGKTLGYAGSVKWTHHFGQVYTEAEVAAPVVTGFFARAELGCAF